MGTTHEPRVLSAEETRRILGVGRSTFYQLAKRDALPVPTIRVGRALKFSRAAVEELLGRRHEAQPSGMTGAINRDA